MNDFQVGDYVETNEVATEELRGETILNGYAPEGKSAYYKPGERGVITDIQYDNNEPYLIGVRFSDGVWDNLFAVSLDLVYRPINNPALYAKSLLDLVDEAVGS